MTIPDSGRMMDNGESCLPCTPDEERRTVSELVSKAETNLREGNLYFIVSNRWYAGWKRYVGEDVDPSLNDCSTENGSPKVPKSRQRPGPIDNKDILSSANGVQNSEYELRRPLEEGRDYVIVPEEAWKKLFEWYKGDPPLPRKLISQGTTSKSYYVEVYPLRLKLTDARDNSEFVITISKKTSVHDLYEKLCALKGLEKDKVCIWDFFNKTTHTKLPPSDVTLEASDLQMDQDFMQRATQKEEKPKKEEGTSHGSFVSPVTECAISRTEDDVAEYYQQQVEMLEGFNEMDALAERGFILGMSNDTFCC